jgi:hypothetical protein
MILADTKLFNVSGKCPSIPLVTRCCKISVPVSMKCEVVPEAHERIRCIMRNNGHNKIPSTWISSPFRAPE